MKTIPHRSSRKYKMCQYMLDKPPLNVMGILTLHPNWYGYESARAAQIDIDDMVKSKTLIGGGDLYSLSQSVTNHFNDCVPDPVEQVATEPSYHKAWTKPLSGYEAAMRRNWRKS